MKTLIKLTISAATFASLLTIIHSAQAATITVPINTGIAGKTGMNIGNPDSSFTWNYSGNYQDPRYPTYGFNDDFSWIMKNNIGSNNDYGSDVPGNMPSFYGVAHIYHTFELPKDATDIKLDFTAIAADDRVVLDINGNEVGRYAFALPAHSSASGRMMDGNKNYVPKQFDGNGWEGFKFNNQNLFNVGGINVLRFWVNNTFSTDPNAPAKALSSQAGDLAWTNFKGTLSYTIPDSQPVPESSATLGLVFFGAAGSWVMRNRKKPVVAS
ncbi:hypothetical protein B6N60_04565 [Richelia sinica FACHB-800]|uniref:PEP-CTERM protein-sorting domain-containing protein n=1 Tax=Richelia sinica FACHB-800 TaxID=1357546 RepID=A0A975Y710_9NOST|nr:hypothetical protein [Richelia sinica]MBD2667179.1 hypothetical protein [Richelia sinica FACHB-800]QXE25845.1 hypothetical protein B6N60_04565 [Richelia sinica FACHB-800]